MHCVDKSKVHIMNWQKVLNEANLKIARLSVSVSIFSNVQKQFHKIASLTVLRYTINHAANGKRLITFFGGCNSNNFYTKFN